jgi:hypothetical protein
MGIAEEQEADAALVPALREGRRLILNWSTVTQEEVWG